MSHPRTSKRHLTDMDLALRNTEWLYDLAGDCEIEPADPQNCDSCAAYVIAQNKQAQREENVSAKLLEAVEEFQPPSVDTLRYWLKLGRNAAGLNQINIVSEWNQGWNACIAQLRN